MNKNIKRRYFDFRNGHLTLAPLISFSNFMMLAYLTINEFIPIWLFAPLFTIAVLISFTVVGNYFRKIQVATDLNMGYEKATESATTFFMMMKSDKKIMDALNIPYPEGFESRLDYMRRISENKL